MSKSRPTTSQTQNTKSRRSELHTHTHDLHTPMAMYTILVYIHALVPHPQSIFATTPFPPSYLRVGYPHGIQHIDVLAPYSFVFASFELYIMTKRPQYSSIQTNVICIYFILANHWSIRIYIFSGIPLRASLVICDGAGAPTKLYIGREDVQHRANDFKKGLTRQSCVKEGNS